MVYYCRISLLLIFCSLIACSTKTSKEIKASKVAILETIKDTNYNTNQALSLDKNEPNTHELNLFLKEHTLPISSIDLRELENNVDYKFPLLLNNREKAFENGDTTFYFSKNFNSKIGFLRSENSKSHQYQLIIFDKYRNFISECKTECLDSEESPDYFRPFDNANGFAQYASRFDMSMNLKIFKIKNERFSEVFSLQDDDTFLTSVCISEDGNYISLITKNEKSYNISKYRLDGKLIFSKNITNIDILSTSGNISSDGKYISYYYKTIENGKSTGSRYVVLNDIGEIIFDEKVFHVGNYTSEFITLNGIEYLIVNGHNAYIIDLSHKKLIKEIAGSNEDTKTYRIFVKDNHLIILFIQFKFKEKRKIQDKKYIKKFEIATGLPLDSLVIPIQDEIGLYLENNQFYLKIINLNSENKIYKLKY